MHPIAEAIATIQMMRELEMLATYAYNEGYKDAKEGRAHRLDEPEKYDAEKAVNSSN